MLKKLSVRNAKRQFREYALFFLTLACCAAVMYAFHALLFSDTVKALPDMELLPWLIVTASLLIILIMGWIIGYMINYMLRRRSKEFSIYMVSGISNREIGMLIFLENSMIGLLAFLPGIVLGMLFSQILEAVLLNLFGLPYQFHFVFSLPAVGLTFVYFSAMLLSSVRRNRKWIRRMKLREMLLLGKQNEKPPVSGNLSAVSLFFLSVFAGCIGFWLLCAQPFGKGYDVLIGTVCLAFFLFGFFVSVPSFLVVRFGSRADWKYRKHRLVIFRGFTARISSASIVMGILSVLFMLSITFGAVGTVIGMMVTENVEAGAFDLMFLHKGERYDFASYRKTVQENAGRGYVYALYSDGETDLKAVHDRAVLRAGRELRRPYAEFRYDTCIRQSDYLELRKLLGYELPELNPSLCYVHCVPVLEKDFKTLISQQKGLECAGFSFAADGVFSEPFSQMNDYGNGAGYVVIVPDSAAEQMPILYSVYAVITGTTLNPADLQKITEDCESLDRLDRTMAKSDPDGAPTALIRDGMDYLTGKWMDKAEFHYLYAIVICLFYLALILEITGAAILATQVLSDWQAGQRQDRILRQLGMSETLVSRLNSRQLAQIFLLPLLPAMIVSSCFVYVSAGKILSGFFQLPAVPDLVWIGKSLVITLVLFFLLYAIYYAAARISYEKRR